MALPGQVIRRGEACRSGADDEDVPAGRSVDGLERPAVGEREIAENAPDGVHRHGVVDVAPVAGVLARVVAHAAVHGRERLSRTRMSQAARERPACASASQAWTFSPAGHA